MLSPKDIAAVADKLAKQLWAMSMKAKKPDLVGTMQNERYQRTMSDEYPFKKPSRAGFKPVPEEQKEVWRKLNEKRG